MCRHKELMWFPPARSCVCDPQPSSAHEAAEVPWLEDVAWVLGVAGWNRRKARRDVLVEAEEGQAGGQAGGRVTSQASPVAPRGWERRDADPRSSLPPGCWGLRLAGPKLRHETVCAASSSLWVAVTECRRRWLINRREVS